MGWKWWFGQIFRIFWNSHHMIITIIRSKNHFSKFIFRQKFILLIFGQFSERNWKGPFLKADTINIGWRHNYYGSKFFVVQNRKPNFDHQKRLETSQKHHFLTRNYNFWAFSALLIKVLMKKWVYRISRWWIFAKIIKNVLTEFRMTLIANSEVVCFRVISNNLKLKSPRKSPRNFSKFSNKIKEIIPFSKLQFSVKIRFTIEFLVKVSNFNSKSVIFTKNLSFKYEIGSIYPKSAILIKIGHDFISKFSFDFWPNFSDR